MRIAAFVLGLISGIIGLGLAFFTLFVGGIASALASDHTVGVMGILAISFSDYIAPNLIPMASFLGSNSPFTILFTMVSEIRPKTASMFWPLLAEHSMNRRPFFLAVLKPSS